jgi:hypothetical protein
MAGTLTISTLSDGTNSTSSTNCIKGSAKAWVNFDGTTGTIRTAYNVSSITRAGAGSYYVNFTNAFSDMNYTTVASGGNSTSNFMFNGTVPTTASQVWIGAYSGGFGDNAYQSVAVFR